MLPDKRENRGGVMGMGARLPQPLLAAVGREEEQECEEEEKL